MRRKAILLGFLSVSGQVLILKELIGSFGGSELLIGIGLTGWLIAVAGGAYLTGRLSRKVSSNLLFAAAVILLPLSLAAIRLAPLWATTIPIELIPFGRAALFSLLMPMPLALLSGMLFSTVSREGWRPVDSIVQVYLFEGIGSFVGGLTIAMLVGPILTTLTMSLVICAVVSINLLVISRPRYAWLALTLCLAAVVLVALGRDRATLDRYLDQLRYKSYRVEASFDTHYGHQTILSRNDATILLTDGRTEANLPDRESAETIVLTPMLQRSNLQEILYIGRGEFGLMQLAKDIKPLRVVTVDPRFELSEWLDHKLGLSSGLIRYDATLERGLRSGSFGGRFDAVVLAPGQIESYQTARYYSRPFIAEAKRALTPTGLLLLIAPFDTERYISEEAASILAPIRAQLAELFRYVSVWPGTSTWFLASDAPILTNLDSLTARIDSLPVQPLFVRSDVLAERMDPFRSDRLKQAMMDADSRHSAERPQLVKRQLLANARVDGSYTAVATMTDNIVWPIIAALAMLAFLVWPLFSPRPQSPRYGLVLLFVAGFASLALELVSFYLFQTAVGFLYADLAIMVGVFMLGLSLGASAAGSSKSGALEYPSLLILIVASVALWLTYGHINQSLLLVYYSLFLLVTALVTGSLFVAASRRYYEDAVLCNRGVSYTVELIGSALAGLLVIPVLIPLIGVNGLILSVTAIAAIAFGGAVRTAYR